MIVVKKNIWILIIITVSLLIIGSSQYPKLYIATGYGAKCMASGVFLAGRDLEKIQANDLNYSAVKFTSSKIDYKEKSVITSIFGLARQKAIFREGFGCYLVDLTSSNDLQPAGSTKAREFNSNWKLPWPEGDQKSELSFSEIDTIALKQAVKTAFDESGTRLKKTAAVVVAYRGKLIAEQYLNNQSINSETRLWGWSMNKSVINAMIGVLVKQGKIALNAAAPIEEWLQDGRREITVNDLMHMSSGLKWNEDYSDVSEVTNMLYRERNCYQSAISVPLENVPGSDFKYSSGTANILSGIVRKVLCNDKQYSEFPYTELFRKIGMYSAVLEQDSSGYFVGSSYGYATGRDWAKFGQLFLQDGVWKGDSILPKGWVAYTRTPAKAAKGQYGAQFWLNRSKNLPDAPEDMFSCQGHRGQRIFIIPSRHLVVVRLGFGEDKFDHNLFLKDILSAIKP